MYIYHNVLNIKTLESIIEKGFILKDEKYTHFEPCVYLTRNPNYLSNRGIRIVFDYNKLKYNYKIKPFCYKGWMQQNGYNTKIKNDEMEERCYNNINIIKCCVRIDIDITKYPNLNIVNPLICFRNKFILTSLDLKINKSR